jgi:hypothetical protein
MTPEAVRYVESLLALLSSAKIAGKRLAELVELGQRADAAEATLTTRRSDYIAHREATFAELGRTMAELQQSLTWIDEARARLSGRRARIAEHEKIWAGLLPPAEAPYAQRTWEELAKARGELLT